jgi:hypothetical protein
MDVLSASASGDFLACGSGCGTARYENDASATTRKRNSGGTRYFGATSGDYDCLFQLST